MGIGGVVQWRIVVNDGRIVEMTEVVGVEGSRVIFERYRPPRDTVLKNGIAWRLTQQPTGPSDSRSTIPHLDDGGDDGGMPRS